MSMWIGDAFWIGTDSGQRADKVNGKALRLRETLILEDPDGRELARSRNGRPDQRLEGAAADDRRLQPADRPTEPLDRQRPAPLRHGDSR
jgi:hypothetical protein